MVCAVQEEVVLRYDLCAVLGREMRGVGFVDDIWVKSVHGFSVRVWFGKGEARYAFRYEMALSTFFMPTFAVLCRIWRCRFDISTSSPSTRPMVPTPAPARYAAAGQPRPPAPTMRIEAALRRI